MSDNYGKLVVADETKRLVAGFANVAVLDRQGDVVPTEAMFSAMLDYMARPNGGIILQSHTNKPVGKVVQWDVRKPEGSDAEGIHIVAMIDTGNGLADETWGWLKDGTLTGFSIGGVAKDTEKVRDKTAVGGVARKLAGIELHEISLVQIPANQLANVDGVSMAKGCDDGTCDKLTKEVHRGPFDSQEEAEAVAQQLKQEGKVVYGITGADSEWFVDFGYKVNPANEQGGREKTRAPKQQVLMAQKGCACGGACECHGEEKAEDAPEGPTVKEEGEDPSLVMEQDPNFDQQEYGVQAVDGGLVKAWRQRTGAKPSIGVAGGTARYLGTETEDANGRWDDTYVTRDGYWVVHSGKDHDVYQLTKDEGAVSTSQAGVENARLGPEKKKDGKVGEGGVTPEMKAVDVEKPFKSRAQQRWAFWSKQPWAREWAGKTKFRSLPEHKMLEEEGNDAGLIEDTRQEAARQDRKGNKAEAARLRETAKAEKKEVGTDGNRLLNRQEGSGLPPADMENQSQEVIGDAAFEERAEGPQGDNYEEFGAKSICAACGDEEVGEDGLCPKCMELRMSLVESTERFLKRKYPMSGARIAVLASKDVAIKFQAQVLREGGHVVASKENGKAWEVQYDEPVGYKALTKEEAEKRFGVPANTDAGPGKCELCGGAGKVHEGKNGQMLCDDCDAEKAIEPEQMRPGYQEGKLGPTGKPVMHAVEETGEDEKNDAYNEEHTKKDVGRAGKCTQCGKPAEFTGVRSGRDLCFEHADADEEDYTPIKGMKKEGECKEEFRVGGDKFIVCQKPKGHSGEHANAAGYTFKEARDATDDANVGPNGLAGEAALQSGLEKDTATQVMRAQGYDSYVGTWGGSFVFANGKPAGEFFVYDPKVGEMGRFNSLAAAKAWIKQDSGKSLTKGKRLMMALAGVKKRAPKCPKCGSALYERSGMDWYCTKCKRDVGFDETKGVKKSVRVLRALSGK